MRRWAERIVILLVGSYFALFLFWNADTSPVRLKLWHVPGTDAPAGAIADPEDGVPQGPPPNSSPTVPPGHVTMPGVMVAATGFVAGFVIAGILTAFGALQRTAELRQARRRVASLEQELARARNLPMDEDLHAPPEPEPAGTATD